MTLTFSSIAETGERSKQPKSRLVMKLPKRNARKPSPRPRRRSTNSMRNMQRRKKEIFARISKSTGSNSSASLLFCCVEPNLTPKDREYEEEFLSNLTNSLSAGTTWERISDLIDLQNSQSKTLARTGPGSTDLSRFKEVLLRLKREGESAPGAAGY